MGNTYTALDEKRSLKKKCASNLGNFFENYSLFL